MKRIFVLSLFFCLAAPSMNNAASRELVSQSTAQTPQVSDEFLSEVAQLTSTGLRLKEAVEARLEGSAHHLAAIFQRDKPKAPNEAYELRIIESDGGPAKTIFRRNDFFFSFSIAGQNNKLNATDINGDGQKEIIAQSSSGGNCWSCNPTEIYRVRNHKAELLAAAPIQRLVDLNGDGIYELVVTDSRWESYDDLSHAASPGTAMIYAWRDGKYVYASRDFGEFYKTEISKFRSSIEEAKSQITTDELSDEVYVGFAISLALAYSHSGDTDRGLKELEDLFKTNAKSPAQTKHRTAIMEDFRNGDSAKKLREMKYGDPMPL